jgi:acyl-CoA synthetase (AMP-forming)/AMP-acid ligase II
VLVTLPMYYSYALVAQALAALVQGCRLAVSGPPFTVPAYRDTVRAAGATVSSLTPALVRSLLAAGGRLPEPLRMLTVGGDRLPAEQVAALLAANPGRELYLTYGLTEAGPRVTTLVAHREPPHRHASVGLPLPGVQVSIREPDPAGVGELLVRTDTAFVRRVGRLDGTGRSALRAPGVVATGDRFAVDADGYLYFQGRLSDFVVLNGEKVSLASVRQLASSVPGVVRAANRAHPGEDGRGGYDLELFVDRPELADQIRRTVAGLLLRAERPHRIDIRASHDVALHK